MSAFTCEDCLHWDNTGRKMAICSLDERVHDADEELCPNFRTKDGRCPRFCRLASSVDELAEALIRERHSVIGYTCWELPVINQCYAQRKNAIAAAKAWLMEEAEE